MYRQVGGVCLATLLFVCGATGFPLAPLDKPPSNGPVVVQVGGEDTGTVTEGGTFQAAAQGFAAEAAVTFALYSSPTEVAHAVADAAGNVSAEVELPSGVTNQHTLVALGNAPDGSTRALESTITIAPAAAPAASLAYTGARVGMLALAGVLLLLVGLGLVRTAAFRRRLLPER